MVQPQASRQLKRVDRQTFLSYVRQSGLLEAEELSRAIVDLPYTDRGRLVARHLVEKGLLTRFQAERLLAGLTEGFLLGQYRILDQIGRGGMGQVFKAEHRTMNRVVAMKIISPSLTKTERARQLFDREVRAAARLNHPNIITAFDANQEGDRCYLVMEFVDGPNLSDLVKEHGPLPPTQACELIRQAAIGLSYAHELGMVHRDIKPANLLVQKATSKAVVDAYIVKILDFGLARLASPEPGEIHGEDSIITMPQSVMGTPDYLAPEQARNLHLADHRSDIYSLGCTFYYLLTGSVPFPNGSPLEKMLRHSTDEPVPVRLRRPEIPQEIADIVAVMMAKNPKDRFASASEVAVVLDPRSEEENNGWVTISPLPVDNTIPNSTTNLPRVSPLAPEDPWANLEDEPGHSTIINQGGNTRHGNTQSRLIVRNNTGPSTSTWPHFLLAMIVLLVLLGVVWFIRFMMDP